MRQIIFFIIGLTFFFISMELKSQENESKSFYDTTFVISSSKYLQPQNEAASKVEVITAEDIQMSGATNLGDVLRSVVGVDVRESDAMQHVLGVRGICDSGHLLVLIDGNEAFFRNFNYAYLDWLPVAIEDVERIEIVKGGLSSLYGANAANGVINIITKKPEDLETIQVNAVYGEHNTLRANAIGSGSIKNFDFSYSLGHKSGLAWDASISYAPNNYQMNMASFIGEFKLKNNELLSLSARFSEANNVFSRIAKTKNLFLSAKYHTDKNFTIRFANSIHRRYHEEYISPVNEFDYMKHVIIDNSSYVEVNKKVELNNLRILFGGYFRYTKFELNQLYPREFEDQFTETHFTLNEALFFRSSYKFFKKLILNGDFRIENDRSFDQIWAGRLSLVYNPNKKNHFRLNVSKSNVIPSLLQKEFAAVGFNELLGNQDIKPEIVYTSELGYEFLPNRNIKIGSTLFYSLYKKLIVNGCNWWAFYRFSYNLTENDQLYIGLESYVKISILKQINFEFNHTYYHQNQLHMSFGVPKNKVNLILSAKFKKISLYCNLHYVDKYIEVHTSSNPYFSNNGWRYREDFYDYWSYMPYSVKSYYTFNSSISYTVKKRIRFSISAYNLFDNKHFESNDYNENFDDPGQFVGDELGRRITFGLHLKF